MHRELGSSAYGQIMELLLDHTARCWATAHPQTHLSFCLRLSWHPASHSCAEIHRVSSCIQQSHAFTRACTLAWRRVEDKPDSNLAILTKLGHKLCHLLPPVLQSSICPEASAKGAVLKLPIRPVKQGLNHREARRTHRCELWYFEADEVAVIARC